MQLNTLTLSVGQEFKNLKAWLSGSDLMFPMAVCSHLKVCLKLEALLSDG